MNKLFKSVYLLENLPSCNHTNLVLHCPLILQLLSIKAKKNTTESRLFEWFLAFSKSTQAKRTENFKKYENNFLKAKFIVCPFHLKTNTFIAQSPKDEKPMFLHPMAAATSPGRLSSSGKFVHLRNFFFISIITLYIFSQAQTHPFHFHLAKKKRIVILEWSVLSLFQMKEEKRPKSRGQAKN